MAAALGNPLPLLRFHNLASLPHVVHGVTSRAGGMSEGTFSTLNLSLSVGDDDAAVIENRRRVAAAFDRDESSMITTRQVHGADAVLVDEIGDLHDRPPRADVLVTGQPGVLLMQRFADCVPILLASERAPAVAVAHAGWRGTLAGAAASAVKTLVEGYGVAPRQLVAAIGPSIGACCYEVGDDVAGQFESFGPSVVQRQQPRPYLDLWEANRQVLIRSGVPATNIEVSAVCTRCQADTYFSHRAMGFPAGRFGAVIGLRA